MKKKQLIIFSLLLTLSIGTIKSQGTVKLETCSDSIAYAIGTLQSQHLINPAMNMGKEQRAMFLKGLMEAQRATEADSLQKAYYVGLTQGLNFVDESVSAFNENIFQEEKDMYIKKEVLLAGLADGVLQNGNKLKIDTLDTFLNRAIEKIQVDVKAKKYAENKKASEEFLAKNKKKKGVKTLPSGLQYKVITAGKGEKPKEDDTVEVHYKGTLTDGTEFDSSYSRNETFKTGLKGVIKGWTEVLQLMPVGSKWEIYIPSSLAYEDNEMGNIKPFSTLIFQIELIGIEK